MQNACGSTNIISKLSLSPASQLREGVYATSGFNNLVVSTLHLKVGGVPVRQQSTWHGLGECIGNHVFCGAEHQWNGTIVDYPANKMVIDVDVFHMGIVLAITVILQN